MLTKLIKKYSKSPETITQQKKVRGKVNNIAKGYLKSFIDFIDRTHGSFGAAF